MVRLAVVLALVLAPGDGDAREFAGALRAYRDAYPGVVQAATPAYAARRDAVAGGCLDVVRDGAPHQLVTLARLYGDWAASPVADALRPEKDRLVRRLRAVDEPPRPLRRARVAFARRVVSYGRIPRLLPDDLCATLRAWQAAGWRDAAEPPEWGRVIRVYTRVHRRDDPALQRGARALRRHGIGAPIADLLRFGDLEDDALYAGDPVFAALEDAVTP